MRGRPRYGPRARRGAMISDRTQLICHETPWQEDERAQYVVAAHPDGLCCDEIGALLGVSRERARQILSVAVCRLYTTLRREGWSQREVGEWLLRPQQDSPPESSVPADEARRARMSSTLRDEAEIASGPWSEHGRRVDAAIVELERRVARLGVE